MFYSQQGYAGNRAARGYAAVHSGSRIEGATPHALVKVLFDELLIALEATALAERNNDRLKVSDKQARAMSILIALESSLDFDKGGDIAMASPKSTAKRAACCCSAPRNARPIMQSRPAIS